MPLSRFEKDMQIIRALDDEPNDVGGMTPEQLKARFDEGGEALKQYLNGTLTPELDAFLARRDNPHEVSKAQVGLGSCDNTADADKPVSAAQQAALDLKTDRAESAVRQAQLDAQQAALAAHTARADNPHGVTRAQVGLGHCDDTADADKPVSAAQQAALDLKTDRTVSAAQQAQIDRKAERAAVLEKDNAEPYTPTADHHPATKRYVDQVAGNAALGQVPDGSISTAKLALGAVTREKLAAEAVTPESIGAATAVHAGSHAAGGADPVTPGSIGAATAAELAAHAGRADNPHAVTAAQAGADPAGSAAGVQNNLNWHAARTDNPHGVNCGQIGAAAAGHTHTPASIGAQDAATAINTGNVGSYAIAPGALTAYLASVGGIRAEAVEYRGSNYNYQTLTFSFPPKFVIVTERTTEGGYNGQEWAYTNVAGSIFINCITRTGTALCAEAPSKGSMNYPDMGITPELRLYRIKTSGNSVTFYGPSSAAFFDPDVLYVATAFG